MLAASKAIIVMRSLNSRRIMSCGGRRIRAPGQDSFVVAVRLSQLIGRIPLFSPFVEEGSWKIGQGRIIGFMSLSRGHIMSAYIINWHTI